jgi:peptidoglycan hydrolase CwlO-like protein
MENKFLPGQTVYRLDTRYDIDKCLIIDFMDGFNDKYYVQHFDKISYEIESGDSLFHSLFKAQEYRKQKLQENIDKLSNKITQSEQTIVEEQNKIDFNKSLIEKYKNLLTDYNPKYNIGDNVYILMCYCGLDYSITEATIQSITSHEECSKPKYTLQIKDTIMLTVCEEDDIYETSEEAENSRLQLLKKDIDDTKNSILDWKCEIGEYNTKIRQANKAISNLESKLELYKKL